MNVKLTKISYDVWKSGEYTVRRSEMGGGYSRYVVMGPGVRNSSYSGSDIRTLAEAREVIAEAMAGA